jgi:transcriptional regulator with XRE-family HTH domain
MQDEGAEVIHEGWVEEQPITPPHSRLYHLEPLGTSTPYVESLTSYVARLAEAHSVHLRDLLIYELTPHLRQLVHRATGRLKAGAMSRFLMQSVTLNEPTKTAKSLVQGLEMLTGRNNLSLLTLLPFTGAVSLRKLLRPTQAWCSWCFEMWREMERPVYEPLIWSFASLSLCALHGEPLQTHCPFCMRARSPLTSRLHPGYCPWCNRWLGQRFQGRSNLFSPPRDESWKQQQWIGHMLGEILAVAPSFSRPLRQEDALSVLSIYVNGHVGGQCAVAARHLGLTQSTLGQWLAGKHIPQVRNLLQVCCSLGISLLSLLQGTADEFPLAGGQTWMLPPSEPRRKPFRKFDAEAIRQALQKSLEEPENPPPSLNQVGQQLRYSTWRLSKLFPDLCHAISSRYQAYRVDQRRLRYQNRCEEVRQAVLHLYAQGVHPSESHVKTILKNPSILRFPEIRSAWKMALREVERG